MRVGDSGFGAFLWCETGAFTHATVITANGLDLSIGKPQPATYLWAFPCISNRTLKEELHAQCDWHLS
jgi:hypothetical protein